MDSAGATQPSKIGRLIPDDVWGILCIFAEARGEVYEGQVAVGNVVRNRTRRRFFSQGTVCSTVTFPKQFSWCNASDPQRQRVFGAVWEDPAIKTAARAWFESEHRKCVPDDVTHYHTLARPAGVEQWPPFWARLMSARVTIGGHVFYSDDDR
jgi:spore germination cell wall hydrolase CwlJ-like protein